MNGSWLCYRKGGAEIRSMPPSVRLRRKRRIVNVIYLQFLIPRDGSEHRQDQHVPCRGGIGEHKRLRSDSRKNF